MFWLVLYLSSPIVIPEKYPDLESCKKAAEVWVKPKEHACIPAPKNVVDDYFNCTTYIPNIPDDGRYRLAKVNCIVPTGLLERLPK